MRTENSYWKPGRPGPNDTAALDTLEQSALCGLFLDPSFATMALSRNKMAGRWKWGTHETIYAAMRLCMQARIEISLLSVSKALRSVECLEDCGGDDYLISLAANIPSGPLATGCYDNLVSYRETEEARGESSDDTLAHLDKAVSDSLKSGEWEAN